MVKAKKYSEADLADFYLVSPLFKKYSLLRLWSYNFSEYSNIKYCEIYFSKYFLVCTEKYILEYFGEFFLLTLLDSPKFLKFIESGFFKYINYHFLLLFQSNCLFFFEDSFEEVEFFVEEYFRLHIKKTFERDLLICLAACINKRVPVSFDIYLSNHLKYISNKILLIKSNTKSSFNSISILNFIESDIDKYYFLGFIYFKNNKSPLYKIKYNVGVKKKYNCSGLTVLNYKIYKSVNIIKEVSGVIKQNYIKFFFEGITCNYESFVVNSYNNTFLEYYNYFFKNIEKYKYLSINKKVNFYFKFYPTLFMVYKGSFYNFSKCVYKLPYGFIFYSITKDSNSCNYDFQLLLGSFQILVSFDKIKNDIGVYLENTNVFIII
uniref:Uncharacterized protein n=1 Tax=Macrocystis integrifolia TaxID=169774 RepID=A0A4D6E5E5_9PHAE|nr:hypothetical protein [Macrocystis integrifolia]QBZ73731.1 hypothetical protein [Macrocystis integrifolia]